MGGKGGREGGRGRLRWLQKDIKLPPFPGKPIKKNKCIAWGGSRCCKEILLQLVVQMWQVRFGNLCSQQCVFVKEKTLSCCLQYVNNLCSILLLSLPSCASICRENKQFAKGMFLPCFPKGLRCVGEVKVGLSQADRHAGRDEITACRERKREGEGGSPQDKEICTTRHILLLLLLFLFLLPLFPAGLSIKLSLFLLSGTTTRVIVTISRRTWQSNLSIPSSSSSSSPPRSAASAAASAASSAGRTTRTRSTDAWRPSSWTAGSPTRGTWPPSASPSRGTSTHARGSAWRGRR